MKNRITAAAIIWLCISSSIAASPQKTGVLFGISLDTPIESIPTCEAPETAPDKICVHETATGTTRYIELRPQRPEYIKSNLWATVSEGKITNIRVLTNGLETQNEVLRDLTARYGKPSTISRQPAQNKFGAQFSIIEAMWSGKNWGVIFVGASKSLDEGYISLSR